MDLRDGKGFWASVMAAVSTVINSLIGDPFGPHGRAVALVVIMMLLDFLLGTADAIATRTWSFAGLRKGTGKLLIWGALLVIARQISAGIEVASADPVLKFGSDYIIVYLIMIDLVSCLQHCDSLAGMAGVAVPGLSRLVRMLQATEETFLAQPAPPSSASGANPAPPALVSSSTTKGPEPHG